MLGALGQLMSHPSWVAGSCTFQSRAAAPSTLPLHPPPSASSCTAMATELPSLPSVACTSMTWRSYHRATTPCTSRSSHSSTTLQPAFQRCACVWERGCVFFLPRLQAANHTHHTTPHHTAGVLGHPGLCEHPYEQPGARLCCQLCQWCASPVLCPEPGHGGH